MALLTENDYEKIIEELASELDNENKVFDEKLERIRQEIAKNKDKKITIGLKEYSIEEAKSILDNLLKNKSVDDYLNHEKLRKSVDDIQKFIEEVADFEKKKNKSIANLSEKRLKDIESKANAKIDVSLDKINNLIKEKEEKKKHETKDKEKRALEQEILELRYFEEALEKIRYAKYNEPRVKLNKIHREILSNPNLSDECREILDKFYKLKFPVIKSKNKSKRQSQSNSKAAATGTGNSTPGAGNSTSSAGNSTPTDNNSTVPEMPTDITNNPKVSWRSIAALALGIASGVSAVVFLPSGIGIGVAVVGGGLIKTFARRRRKKLQAERLKMVNDFNNSNASIKQYQDIIKDQREKIANNNTKINTFNAMLSSLSTDKKKALNTEIKDLETQIKNSEELIQKAEIGIQEAQAEMTKIKNELTIRNVVEPPHNIKELGSSIVKYFKSEEAMRDLQWFSNGAIYSAVAAQMLGLAGIGITPANTPTTTITNTSGSQVAQVQTQPQPTGHHIGDSVSDLNLTNGYDSASLAGSGTNKEQLIQSIMQDGHSVYQGAYIQDPTSGMYNLYNGPMSMEELVAQYGSKVSFKIGDEVTGIARMFSNATELGLNGGGMML